jgi:hypothetical protein
MPIGVYFKQSHKSLKIGDIIVFKTNNHKGNLIKFCMKNNNITNIKVYMARYNIYSCGHAGCAVDEEY